MKKTIFQNVFLQNSGGKPRIGIKWALQLKKINVSRLESGEASFFASEHSADVSQSAASTCSTLAACSAASTCSAAATSFTNATFSAEATRSTNATFPAVGACFADSFPASFQDAHAGKGRFRRFRQVRHVHLIRLVHGGALLAVLLLLIFSSGCSVNRLTRSRLPSPGRHWFQRSVSAMVPVVPKYSEATTVGLRTLSLDKTVRQNPQKAVEALEELLHETPNLEFVGMLAEVAYWEGKRLSQHRITSEISGKQVAKWYLLAARNAYSYLFDERWNAVRNPYSPSFQNVCRIFNESTEEILRRCDDSRSKLQFGASPSFTLDLPDSRQAIPLEMLSREWTLDDFSVFLFASDFEITGLKNRYRRYGLGVPMVARCRNGRQNSPRFRYCLQEMCAPMTVFFSFDESGTPTLLILDAMERSTAQVGSISVPLEIDYTTPLAYSFELASQKNALDGATVGLLNPDFLLKETEDGTRLLKGVYMPQAYDPNKIPVVMVHGLWSSVMTWMEMYNTLNSIPEIRENYQFWFYCYPNGQPFWVSATQLRDDLDALRKDLDPTRENTNMDRMILVGHSMGGLVALLQTIDSEERFWNQITSVPASELPGNPETNREVARWFHARPNPSISCVITMGTPCLGSGYANSTTRGITGFFGKKASLVEGNLERFKEENREKIHNTELLDCFTALDSLQKDSVFWDALAETKPACWVAYVNVIARMKEEKSGSLSDGVVSLESARLPWESNEFFITAFHHEITNDAEAILVVAGALKARIKTHPPQKK